MRRALTIGVGHAAGQIFVFSDSDCVLERDAMSRVVSAFCAHPDLGAVSGHARALNAERNLLTKTSAAVTIFDSHQTWGRPDRGIQLFGTAGTVSGTAARQAERAYAARFPSYDPSDSYPVYRFRARQVKLFYERVLGGGTLVTARVTRDRLAWLRTEVWA